MVNVSQLRIDLAKSIKSLGMAVAVVTGVVLFLNLLPLEGQAQAVDLKWDRYGFSQDSITFRGALWDGNEYIVAGTREQIKT